MSILNLQLNPPKAVGLDDSINAISEHFLSGGKIQWNIHCLGVGLHVMDHQEFYVFKFPDKCKDLII